MKHINRIAVYVLGLFIITVGINLSIKSGLGSSPVSAFILPVSQITNMNLGTVTTACYVLFVLIQMVLLKKEFHIKHILQIPFSMMFGMFIDVTGTFMDYLQMENYLMQFMALLISILLCAIGAAMYIAMDIVPNAPEGLQLSFCKRFQLPFSKVKIVSDCMFVSLGLMISLIFVGTIGAIREGTILSALCTGKLIKLISKVISPTLQRMAFYDDKANIQLL